VLLAVVYRALLAECSSALGDFVGPGSPQMPASFWLALNLWLPVALIGSLCVLAVLALTVPEWRRSLRWRFPAFRESSLSQLAAALALLLERGCPLDKSLGLVQQLEAGSPMGREIAQWQTRLAAGHKEFSELAAGGKVVPPLFVWLVAGSGEDWAGGFQQAAKVYYERAIHQVEVLLYAALPVSVLALGVLILAQVLPMVRLFAGLMRSLISDCGMAE
jgi:type II secretory pathway component PulF